MESDDARVKEKAEFQRGGGLDEAHDVSAAVGGLVAALEGTAFDEAENEHAEFFEVLREDELTGRVATGGRTFAVAGEDVDGLFCERVADVFEGSFGHPSCGYEWRLGLAENKKEPKRDIAYLLLLLY